MRLKYQFQGQRSRSPGPLMLTQRAPYRPNAKVYKLHTWYQGLFRPLKKGVVLSLAIVKKG